MQINIESKMGASEGKGSRLLSGNAKTTIESFFKYCPELVEAVEFVAYSNGRGSSPKLLIKTVPPLPAAKLRPEVVSVCVHTEGTQGVWGVMSIPGLNYLQLKDLIGRGPFDKKPRHHDLVEVTVPATVSTAPKEAELTSVAVAEIAPVAEVLPAQPLVVPTVEVSEAVPKAPRLTPLEKLQNAGFGQEEIDRLKETLSVIVQEETVRQGFTTPQNLLRVSVETITKAILDHMKPQYGRAGNYQGVIGSFYSSKIALFALKYDEKTDSQYEDWLFDCVLITDFVGGQDNLEALAIVRKFEVKALELEEAVRQPAPEPEMVEQAVQGDFVPDNVLFALALRFLEGKDQAVRELALAHENRQKQQDRLAELQAQVQLAQLAVQDACGLVEVAKQKLASLVLTDAAKKRILQAKANLDALVDRLG